MASLKELYESEAEYGAFYTGGVVEMTADGTELLCQCSDSVKVVDISSGSVVTTFAGTEGEDEQDTIYTFKLSQNNEAIATVHKSGLIKLWSKSDYRLIKMWKSSHKGPVACLCFNGTGESLASGGSDGNIRLWNLTNQICTGSLRGALGVFTVLKYHPDDKRGLIFGSADDTKIRSWNVYNAKEHLVFTGHFSKVTSLIFTLDGSQMISSGRDRVLILWSLEDGKAMRTLPVYEGIEGAVLLPPSFKLPGFSKKADSDEIFIACAGEKGVVKVWNISGKRVVYIQENSLVSQAAEDGGLAVTNLIYNDARNCLAIVSSDQNIIIHDLETFRCIRQIVGFTDEIIDLVFLGDNDTHIVAATNSSDLKVYELQSMNCQIVKGHTDIVLALSKFSVNKNVFLSSGKDNSVRLWKREQNNEITCLGIGNRHTASVGSISASQTSLSFFVSVSQDTCLKLWQMPVKLESVDSGLKCSHTEIAHHMDINSVTVSPNDKMVATGSQDKTAKLWSAEDLSLLGVLRGHRRGVWCVKFSPVDQVLLTSSADSTLKLWSLAGLNCLKSFEGHESSVLKADFLTRGLQIISAGADGLIKMWNIKTSECKASMDKHEGKVWALAVSNDESRIITGGDDSLMVKWKDVTVEKKEKEAKEKEELVILEQELMNLLKDNKMTKALKLALRLERPLQVLKIINIILKGGSEKLSETIKEVNTTQKEALLRCAAVWNTNNRNCHAAQVVFNILSKEILSNKIEMSGLGALVQGALPYSERHFERLTNLLQDLNFLTYTMNCMQPHAKAL